MAGTETDGLSEDMRANEELVVTAHALAECGNKGVCNRATGICECDDPWDGPGCKRMGCPNNCNDHGTCTTMRDAAKDFDGFFLNHTTTYDMWDADVMMGCVCDMGYEGFDCSQARMHRGPNPLEITSATAETVKLYCECTSPCKNFLTLSFDGGKTRPIAPTSDNVTLHRILVEDIDTIFGNTNRYILNPTKALIVRMPAMGPRSTVCSDVGSTTNITFLANEGDLPAMMVETENQTRTGYEAWNYEDMNAYFITEQTLTCTCAADCQGSFQLEFDGVLTTALPFSATPTNIRDALVGLRTLSHDMGKDGYVNVANIVGTGVAAGDYAMCKASETRSLDIVFHHKIGNLPRIVPVPSLGYMSDGDNVMSIASNDGSSSASICNGQGLAFTDSTSKGYMGSNCTCSPGFEAGEFGDCGSIQYHSSNWAGLERCPGTVFDDFSPVPVHHVLPTAPLVYFMDNGANKSMYTRNGYGKVQQAKNGPHQARPGISSFNAKDLTRADNSPYTDTHRNLTNGTQAGAALDMTEQRLYFVDHSVRGIRSMSVNGSDVLSMSWMRQDGTTAGSGFSHSRKGWTGSDMRDFLVNAPGLPSVAGSFDGSATLDGIALDLRPGKRFMYVTDPGKRGLYDGTIYAVHLDKVNSVGTPYTEDLTSRIGQTNLRDPLGIAVDLKREYLYWVDGAGNSTMAQLHGPGQLWRCELDGFKTGTNPELVYGNFSSPQGLALNLDNYTAYITDVGVEPDAAIFQIGLDWHLDNMAVMGFDYDYPYEFKNVSGPYKMQDTIQLVTFGGDFQKTHGLRYPYDIALDYVDQRYYISDSELGMIGWGPMQCVTCTDATTEFAWRGNPIDFYRDQDYVVGLYYGAASHDTGRYLTSPVGLALDLRGGYPHSGFHDCWGHGDCLGSENNFKCVCQDGWFGSCQMGECPKGKAWFDEAYAPNQAHELVECSNMGFCDRATAKCQCYEGFEGGACERQSCSTAVAGEECSGHGSCVNMRQAAEARVNALGDPDPLNYGAFYNYSNQTVWEAEKIYGCQCDDGGYMFPGQLHNYSMWTGHDCSKRMCPFGDYISRWAYTAFEQQTLRCQTSLNTEAGGSFKLSFRGALTGDIMWNSSIETLKYELESLSTIGTVSVSFAYKASKICFPLGAYDNIITIEFTSEVGDWSDCCCCCCCCCSYSFRCCSRPLVRLCRLFPRAP